MVVAGRVIRGLSLSGAARPHLILKGVRSVPSPPWAPRCVSSVSRARSFLRSDSPAASDAPICRVLRRRHVAGGARPVAPVEAGADSMASRAGTCVAVIGGGISGLTCANRLARAGCRVTVYETGRGPGGRTATRQTRDPEKRGWQWDHGAQFFTAKTAAFRDLLEEWRAAGCVAEWTGRFGTLDATTGGFTPDPEDKSRWVGTPAMSAIAAHLAAVPGVTVLSSRRVTGFEGGPGSGSPDDTWTIVHRDAGPIRAAGEADVPSARCDPGFAAVVAADKQAASDRSRRVYGEPPPIESAAAPVVWEGMRKAGQTASFALMLAVSSESGTSLFPFEGAQVTGDGRVAWIANDSSKPGRPTGVDATGVQCWVVQSTPEYAAERIEAKLTVPGTSPHQALLAEVADEMLESVMRVAAGVRGGPPEDLRVLHAVAHRWGAAFPTDGAFSLAAEAGGCLSEPGRRVVGCGDFCVSPKVEGAAVSGMAAATAVLDMLPAIPATL